MAFRSWKTSWYDWHGVEHRERVSGTRNVSRPKEISDAELQRREWRERKGFARDRAKERHRWRKTWAKKISNHCHRVWERQQLHRADWDNMIGDYTRITHDPWMWD